MTKYYLMLASLACCLSLRAQEDDLSRVSTDELFSRLSSAILSHTEEHEFLFREAARRARKEDLFAKIRSLYESMRDNPLTDQLGKEGRVTPMDRCASLLGADPESKVALQFVKKETQHSAPYVRRTAWRVLATSFESRCVLFRDEALAALHDSDREVREASAGLIAKRLFCSDREVRNALRKAACDDPDEHTRSEISEIVRDARKRLDDALPELRKLQARDRAEMAPIVAKLLQDLSSDSRITRGDAAGLLLRQFTFHRAFHDTILQRVRDELQSETDAETRTAISSELEKVVDFEQYLADEGIPLFE